ncbi:MAG: hypothetical protein K8963_01630, partial [Proteobacteria bacterium]|nr:hypothetical protein [Pseudomonadota bacterium]
MTDCTAEAALPMGLMLDVSTDGTTCILSGTPVQASLSAAHTITAISTGGNSTLSITVVVSLPAPTLTDATAQATAETPIDTVTVTGNGGPGTVTGCAFVNDSTSPASEVASLGGLGIAISTDASACEITGTLTTPGAQTFTVRATNSAGTGEATISFNVEATPPILPAPAAQTYFTGRTASLDLSNTGGAVMANGGCEAPNGLPPGLSFEHWPAAASCRVRGTPIRALPQGIYPVRARSASGTIDFDIDITVLSTLAQFDAPKATVIRTGKSINIRLPNRNQNAPPISECHAVLPAGLTVSAYVDSGGGIGDSDSGGDSNSGNSGNSGNGISSNSGNSGISSDSGISSSAGDSSSSAGISSSTSSDSNTGGGTGISSDSGSSDSGGSDGGTSTSTSTSTSSDSNAAAGVGFASSGCVLGGAALAYSGQPDPVVYEIFAVNAAGTGTVDVTLQILPPAPRLEASVDVAFFIEGQREPPVVLAGSGGIVQSCRLASGSLPDGLRLESDLADGCRIVGSPTTPTEAADYTVIAANDGGRSERTFRIAVAQRPPLLTPPTTQALALGTAALVRIPSSGGAVQSCTLTDGPALPQGLRLEPTDDGRGCRLVGTPSEPTHEQTRIITATNSAGFAVVPLRLMVVSGVAAFPALPGLPALTFTAGTAVNQRFVSTIATAARISDCTANLPATLTVSTVAAPASGCVVSGTPSGPVPQATYTVTAVNAGGAATLNLDIIINPATPAPAAPEPLILTAAVGTALPLALANTGGAPASDRGCRVSPALPDLLVFEPTADGRSCQVSGSTVAELGRTSPRRSQNILSVHNITGSTDVTLELTIRPPAPAPTALAPVEVTAGEPFTTLAIANTGGAPFNVNGCRTEPALPDGLYIEPTPDGLSCQVSAEQPPIVTAGASYALILVGAGGQAQAMLHLTVLPPPPQLVAIEAQRTNKNVPFLVVIENIGGAADSCTTDATLPAGLELSVADGGLSCQISGTPSELVASTAYALTATNVADRSVVSVELAVVDGAPVMNAPPPLTGMTGKAFFRTLHNSGEQAIVSCSAESLPPGLRIEWLESSDACRLIGTPTTLVPPTPYTITAYSQTESTSLTITIEITRRPPQLAQAVFVTATALEPIAAFVPNHGGAASQCTAAPALPTGLTIEPDPVQSACRLTGMVAAARAPSVHTISATNSSGAASTKLTLTVSPAAPNLISPSPLRLTVGTLASPVVLANLGGPPANGLCQSSDLPQGLNAQISPDGRSCQIAGRPTVSAPAADCTVMAANVSGSSEALVNIEIMEEAPELIAIEEQSFAVGAPVALAWSSTAGPVEACTVDNPLPEGLRLSADTDANACRLTGMVAEPLMDYRATLTATNAGGRDTAEVRFSVSLGTPAFPALAITSDLHIIVGQAVEIVLPTASDVLVTACTADLPDELSITARADGRGCLISGVARQPLPAAAYTIAIQSATATANQPLTVIVTDPPPTLRAPPGVVDLLTPEALLALALANAGGAPGPDGCQIDPGLPPGLSAGVSADGQSCQLSGRARAARPLTVYNISTSNSGGASAAPVSLIVRPPLPKLATVSAQRLIARRRLFRPIIFASTGGAPSADGCQTEPALPEGLTIGIAATGFSCEITGTPAHPAAARIYTVISSNDGGHDSVEFNLEVRPAPPQLRRQLQRSLVPGMPIDIVFINAGGSLETGGCRPLSILPPGLLFERTDDLQNCRLHGTPQAAADLALYPLYAHNATRGEIVTFVFEIETSMPALTVPDILTLTQGEPYTTDLLNGGTGTVTGCTADLPDTLTVTAIAEGNGCRISGTPAQNSDAQEYEIVVATGEVRAVSVVTIAVNRTPPDLTISFNTLMRFTNDLTLLSSEGLRRNADRNGQLDATTFSASTRDASGRDATARNAVAFDAAVSILMDENRLVWTVGQRGEDVAIDNNGGVAERCVAEPALPRGLNVQPGMQGGCVVSGVPSQVWQGSHIISAVSHGGRYSIVFAIEVLQAPPQLAGVVRANFVGGEFGEYLLHNIGGDIAENGCRLDDAVSQPALPEGLRLSTTADSRVCRLAGTPALAQAPTDYTVSASSAGGISRMTLPLHVSAPPPRLEAVRALTATAGDAFTFDFTNTGGEVSDCTISPALPAGLSSVVGPVVPSGQPGGTATTTCRLVGTAPETSFFSFFVLTAQNAEGQSQADFTLTVQAGALALPELRPVIAGTGADIDVIAQNIGQGTIASCAGMLPEGLSIAVHNAGAACRISGRVSRALPVAVYQIRAAGMGGQLATAGISIRIDPLPPILIQPAPFTTVKDRPLTLDVYSVGGTPVACYFEVTQPGIGAVTTTTLAGLNIRVSDNGLDCRITGAPNETGLLSLRVGAANIAGTTDIDITMQVQPGAPILVSPPTTVTADGRPLDALIIANVGGAAQTCVFVDAGTPSDTEMMADADSMAGVTVLDGLKVDMGNSGECVITGVLTGVGNRDYIVRATNDIGDNDAAIAFTVNPSAPKLTSPLAQKFAATAPVSFELTNTGGGGLYADDAPSRGCTVSPDLPTGLSLSRTANARTCIVTGTHPVALAAADYTITATNTIGEDSVAVHFGFIQSSLGLVSQISAGDSHTCAINTNNELYCWGYGSRGQLGLGNNDHRSTPTHVGNATNWAQLSAG